MAVTGVGLVTAGGMDAPSTWGHVLDGRPSAAIDPALTGLPPTLSCRVPGTPPVPPGPGSAQLDPFARLALAATAEALAMAGLGPSTWDGTRVAIVTGCGIGGVNTYDGAAARLAEGGPQDVSPYFHPSFLPNMAAAQLSIRFGTGGPALNVATACASGASAVALAADLLTAGRCDIALACGAEAAVTPLVTTGFARLGALSSKGSRPFDRDRDGFVIAEGAGALVLERAVDARARGAVPLAVLRGHATTGDTHHLVAPLPDGTGIERALRDALADAGVDPADVDHVNAHGTSTPANDRIEAAMIARVLPHGPSVTSAKGALGHPLGAAGAVEAALTVLSIRDGVVPPIGGLTVPDPDLDVDLVVGEARKQAVDIAVSDSFGFGGHNVVLVFARA
ncbi:beta-ketoacyl-[acyl-carrier-protein] synthase family protein [Phytomonospora sp. NPDC050363]|uniref:beta-ketoacyl-[acyl-carrier-protein] synthase family protein n=1 Tax=Phytomonospora sp. NPDC050363 TaxID=3155642 RepID=UPI0033CB406A